MPPGRACGDQRDEDPATEETADEATYLGSRAAGMSPEKIHLRRRHVTAPPRTLTVASVAIVRAAGRDHRQPLGGSLRSDLDAKWRQNVWFPLQGSRVTKCQIEKAAQQRR